MPWIIQIPDQMLNTPTVQNFCKTTGCMLSYSPLTGQTRNIPGAKGGRKTALDSPASLIAWNKDQAKQQISSGVSPSMAFLQQLTSSGASQFRRPQFDSFLKSLGRKTSVAPYHLQALVKSKAIKKVGNRRATYYEVNPSWQNQIQPTVQMS